MKKVDEQFETNKLFDHVDFSGFTMSKRKEERRMCQYLFNKLLFEQSNDLQIT